MHSGIGLPRNDLMIVVLCSGAADFREGTQVAYRGSLVLWGTARGRESSGLQVWDLGGNSGSKGCWETEAALPVEVIQTRTRLLGCGSH